MDNTKNVEYEEIIIKTVYSEVFEAFCDKNGIPHSVGITTGDKCSYWIRKGMDYNDASLMVHKKLWTGANKKDLNLINSLVMNHLFPEVRFQYELVGPTREDELILSAFEG